MLDHSGFRIYYSRRLRQHDGGMMISGVSVSDTQMIPPQQKLYRNVGICGPSCTAAVSFFLYAVKSKISNKLNGLGFVPDGRQCACATSQLLIVFYFVKLCHLSSGLLTFVLCL